MRLYLLERIDGSSVDENCNFVIRASSSDRARGMGNEEARGEGKIWTDKSKASCTELLNDGDEGIVLVDFWDG